MPRPRDPVAEFGAIKGDIKQLARQIPDKSRIAVRADLASEDTALFVWRKDQFNHFAGETVRFGGNAETATLLFETNGLPSNGTEIRFAILNGSTWYVSEAVFTGATNGQLYLDAFNNNTATGKRWAVFTPTANAFDLPDPLPAFGAVDFDDVQAMGVSPWIPSAVPLQLIVLQRLTTGYLLQDTIKGFRIRPFSPFLQIRQSQHRRQFLPHRRTDELIEGHSIGFRYFPDFSVQGFRQPDCN